ncbi:amidohydrolase [Arthrobacter psychrolactophilus]|nr:amidohydrolase [Arthrobacter psychrolactophilus]
MSKPQMLTKEQALHSLIEPDLEDVYKDFHIHPELSFAEHRTAGIVAQRLRANGYNVTEGVGRTGVVGVLDRGESPIVMLRADMDGLPITEATGLDYASTTTGELNGKQVDVMHGCGHDMHTTALLGAAAALAADDSWRGRLVLVFQPAEEVGAGARAMIADGLFERFGVPRVVLGQHVAPLPAGVIGMREGPCFAAADSLKITIHGKGGHGSKPETTVDPIVLASAIVTRLQTVVSREISATESAVVTVGSFHAGDKENIISDRAELALSIRSFEAEVRARVLAAIERIVRGEAATSGAPREPEIEMMYSFPAVVNDAAAIESLRVAFTEELPEVVLLDPGLITGSEDVGILAETAGAPCAFWILGGADPASFEGAMDEADMARVVVGLPSNLPPFYAPVINPTLQLGVNALHTAARTWLDSAS